MEADVLEGAEGITIEAKGRGSSPEVCLVALPGSKTGACMARNAEELGRPCALRRRGGTAVQAKVRAAGGQGVGVPQYEQRRGGTNPRDPAEQKGGTGTWNLMRER